MLTKIGKLLLPFGSGGSNKLPIENVKKNEWTMTFGLGLATSMYIQLSDLSKKSPEARQGKLAYF